MRGCYILYAKNVMTATADPHTRTIIPPTLRPKLRKSLCITQYMDYCIQSKNPIEQQHNKRRRHRDDAVGRRKGEERRFQIETMEVRIGRDFRELKREFLICRRTPLSQAFDIIYLYDSTIGLSPQHPPNPRKLNSSIHNYKMVQAMLHVKGSSRFYNSINRSRVLAVNLEISKRFAQQRLANLIDS